MVGTKLRTQAFFEHKVVAFFTLTSLRQLLNCSFNSALKLTISKVMFLFARLKS